MCEGQDLPVWKINPQRLYKTEVRIQEVTTLSKLSYMEAMKRVIPEIQRKGQPQSYTQVYQKQHPLHPR